MPIYSTTPSGGAEKTVNSRDSDALESHLPMDKVSSHVLRKAGFKEVLPGQAVRLSFSAKLRMWVEGNAADDRYHRAAYEASQRISAVSMAEQYRHAHRRDPTPFDPRQSKLIQQRFVRQDNLRFNPELAGKDQKLSALSRAGVRLARVAHWANGVTELGAAPTGMLLKISRILTMPKRDERSMGSQLRALGFLGPIASLVALFSMAFSRGTAKMADGVADAIQSEIKNTIASFSAVAACSALASLAFSGMSALCTRKLQLKTEQLAKIDENTERYLDRLLDLLRKAETSPGFRKILGLALGKKIPAKYFSTTSPAEPVLLTELLQTIQNKTPEQAKQDISKILGAYMTHRDLHNLNTFPPAQGLLDVQADKAECLQRENHVVALTNLIEHNRLHADAHPHYRDMRHWIEYGATLGRGGIEKMAEARRGSSKAPLSREDKLKDPKWSRDMQHAADRILKNSHQYGPMTVALARASEALRVFNHGVILSFNYQLTRPIAWLAGRLTEHVLKEPNSRTVSFSVGRFIASSIWAVVDAVFLISLAAGNGVGFGGPEAKAAVQFPIKVPYYLVGNGISIISTAAHMVLVAVPAALLMGAAKLACRFEGWKGDRAVQIDDYLRKGRDVLAF